LPEGMDVRDHNQPEKSAEEVEDSDTIIKKM